jgi:hypothetical protein
MKTILEALKDSLGLVLIIGACWLLFVILPSILFNI